MKARQPIRPSPFRPSVQACAAISAAARQAARNAYAPYSRFRVGAALLAADGRVFTGCNVENASYGLTLCAERVALSQAVGQGVRDFRALAVAGGRDAPAIPCGACLQVLAEFCPPGLPILLLPLNKGAVRRTSLKKLLPSVFKLRHPPRP